MATHAEILQSEGYNGSDKLILGIVLGVVTFWLFALSLVNVAPDIQKSIDISIESLNLAISLTALFSGCFIVAAGALADKFGRVRFTYIGFILSIIGSACLVLATETVLFSIGRAIQGLSAACIMPATLSLVKAFYLGAARQRALSFWSIGSWGGGGICSLAGGAIATYLGWRWIFIFSIICSLIGMFLIRGTPESKIVSTEKQARFDYMGLFLFLIALVSLNIVISKGATFGWISPTTLGLAALFIIVGVVFFIVEKAKKSGAFIDFSLFKNKPYSGASFSNFMLNAAAGTLLIVNSYVQEGRGFTPLETGMLSIGYLVAVLVMIRVGEKVLQRIGAKKPMILGTITTGIGISLMALTFLPGDSYLTAVFLGFVLFGLGLGFYATPSTDTAISNAPADKIGVASGIYKMASSLGGAFGIAISASVYAILLAQGHTKAVSAAFGLWVNVGFCVLSLLSIIFMVPKNAGVTQPKT